jgi:hypothetical protein
LSQVTRIHPDPEQPSQAGQVDLCPTHKRYFFTTDGCRTCNLAAKADKASRRADRAIRLANGEVLSLERFEERLFNALACVALLVTLIACGSEPVAGDAQPLPPGVFAEVLDGSPVLAESHVDAIVHLQRDELPGLDVSSYRLVVVDTIEDAFARCGAYRVRSCTQLPSGTIVDAPGT